MSSTLLKGTSLNMEVSDAYWRKRKQRLEKMLEEFQKTGWKTGGFTVNNCDSLRRRLYRDSEKYSSKLSTSHDSALKDSNPFSHPGKKYPVLPGIQRLQENREEGSGDISDLSSEEISAPLVDSDMSMYNDVFRRQGADVTFIRHYEKDDGLIVLRNEHFDPQAKVGSLENADHQAGGGNVKILHKPLDVKSIKSKVGSLENSKHIAQGGKRKIPHHEVHWKAKSKVGSLENMDHQPSGGNISPIFHQTPKWTSLAKVGSLDNIDHVPGRSFRTLQDYMSPFRQRLLKQPNVVWTEGCNQTAISQPSKRLKALTPRH